MIIKKYLASAIFSAFLYPLTCLYAQNNTVIDSAKYQFKYLLTYQMDSTDANAVESEVMLLTVGHRVSKFQSLNGYLRDSVFSDMKKAPGAALDFSSMLRNTPKTKFKEVVFKNYAEAKITYREKIFKDYFEYNNALNLFNWTIREESKQINGYDCQKATMKYAGRSYEAWYTKTIPISDGPYKFNGLPGLIVKIQDTNKHYTYSLMEVKQMNNREITSQNKAYIVTTQKEFSRTKKEFYEDIFAKIAQTGISITLDNPAQKRDIKNKLKKRNNPIELINE